MQAFIIDILFGLSLIFLKIVVIDEGRPTNMMQRVSAPDLIVGIILLTISLIFYVSDTWYYYWILHSLWHLFSFIGAYFFLIGLSKNTKFWYSPCHEIKRSFLWCTLREDVNAV